MIDLDDPAAIAAADPSGALAVAERAAGQWALGIERARSLDDLPSRHGITNVVFCGMGGSGIAGDVLATMAAMYSPVPVVVVKGYRVPACTGPNSLVVCASYSGNTEETLSCFEQALERKGRVVALTTGGILGKLADEHGVPRIAPQEGIQPRAALASLSVPALVVMERLGLLPDLTPDLVETESVLAAQAKALGRETPAAENPAKDLARRLDGMLPVIWGQDGALSAAAVRWRCQLNENAKVPAFSSVLPELDHNELVGYAPGVPALAQVALVVLRKPSEHARVTKRIEITLESVRPRVGLVAEAWATGESRLAQLMSASLFGDFTSIYLAFLRGVDPTPVAVIEDLKLRLG